MIEICVSSREEESRRGKESRVSEKGGKKKEKILETS